MHPFIFKNFTQAIKSSISKKMKKMWARLACLHHSLHVYLSSFFHILLFHVSPFWLHLSYFITLSSLGFIALKASKPTSLTTPLVPKNIDLFFTSTSATTVSSMSTVEMEVFSNTQLIFLTLLMFTGGEVFTSILGLHFFRRKINLKSSSITRIEEDQESVRVKLKLKTIKTLVLLVSFYLLAIQAMGSTLIYIYLTLIPNAKKTLETKHINLLTFSIFTTVSTFANCGFVPTNENMIVFKKNPGLLLILIPQLLLGNTLFPVFLQFLILIMEKITKKSTFKYMLNNCEELGYDHLLSRVRSAYLGFTVLGFLVLQLVVFCALEWYSDGVNGGLSGYEKVVGSVFVVANTRYGGESVFDVSVISPAILVMFVFFMYIPPYTSYLPIQKAESKSINGGNINTGKNMGYLEHVRFSQLTYLLIFIILICITERHNMKHDPLNFNMLNIVFEVISAYGNVGFSMGYSCEKQIKADGHCKDAWTGFAGRWSDAGKFVLILVMFFGRLKKFSQGGGRPWILA